MQMITGGMGFIGLHASKAFLDAGEDVVITRYRSHRIPSYLEAEVLYGGDKLVHGSGGISQLRAA